MSSVPKDRRVAAVRIMAAACVALALMCVGLAVAWNQQREEAACWRLAAEFQLEPDGACGGGSSLASSDPGTEAPAATSRP
jgi:hypothetical protein